MHVAAMRPDDSVGNQYGRMHEHALGYMFFIDK